MNIKEIKSEKNKCFIWGMIYLFCIGFFVIFPVTVLNNFLYMSFIVIWNLMIVFSVSFYLVFRKVFFECNYKLNALTTLERC